MDITILFPIGIISGGVMLNHWWVTRHLDGLSVTAQGLFLPWPMLFTGSSIDLYWDNIKEIVILEDDAEVLADGEHFLPRTIYIEFKTGKAMRVCLKSLTRPKCLNFFLQVNQYARVLVANPEALDNAMKPIAPSDDEPKSAPPSEETQWESFTQMWESELASHNANLCYVPLDAGTELQGGKFKIGPRLSSGGSSTVYIAQTENSSCIVKEAVVPHLTDEATKAKAKELFQREAALLQKLDHHKVAKILDCFVENGRDYLVLEFVEGESLRRYLKKHGPQREEVVLKWAKEIAEILEYLHSQNPPVIHRDLTPDNLVVKPDGSLVLIDFGAANEYLSRATGTMIGKQCYIAPEQFRGKASVSSDLYALGCTMFCLLTGEDPEALSCSHPRALRAEVSETVDALVADCTLMNEEERISSAQKLLSRLESVVDTPSVPAGERK